MQIVFENLYKSFGAVNVLNNISIKSNKRECIGIIGPNGAGKSTLFKIISGNLKQDSGNILINNININKRSNEERARLGISQSFQKNSLFPEMTVLESLMLASCNKFKIAFNMFKPFNKYEHILNHCKKIAHYIGLTPHLNVKSEELSYGLQRQLEIGIAVANDPQLLLLDEPTAGMSQYETKRIIKLIKSLSKKYTILIVEHDMEVVFNLADRICVLDQGNLIFEGSSMEVKRSQLVQKRYLGI